MRAGICVATIPLAKQPPFVKTGDRKPGRKDS